MIAADSNVVIDHLQGKRTAEAVRLADLLGNARAVLAPATVTELLSDPAGSHPIEEFLRDILILPISDGYWERAGALRAKVRKAGRKAALGDALIAQACIDNDTPLLTRDTDFAAFVKIGGLKLA
ncbi:MAG: type II toxin-antitoxin system VapC family toxin [Hyphomonadaceae bacterium]